MPNFRTGAVASLLALLAAPASAQVVNPADNAAKGAEPVDLSTPRQEDPLVGAAKLRTWELPPSSITPSGSVLFEEDRVGPYEQPRWTTRRLFPSTRVYVRSPGQVEFEHWTRVKTPKEGPSTVETQYEVEFGLPGRFQLDLYTVTEKTGEQGELDVSEQKYEIRYALADWGEILLNPTLYFEYVATSGGPDKAEYKLLLGEELAQGWHFGSNLVLEHELSGEGENEYELTLGVARTIVDSKFSLGAEVKAALVDVHDDRGDYTESLEVGPSMRYYPVPDMHIDFAPLVGIGPDSRAADIFLVIGWEF